MIASIVSILAFSTLIEAHRQTPIIAGPHQELWYNGFSGDDGTQADAVFSGIATFARLPYFPCLAREDEKYDIAFLGRSSYLALHPELDANYPPAAQAPRSILELRIDRARDSAPMASDKVLQSPSIMSVDFRLLKLPVFC